MITLNNVIKWFEDWADNHLQIQTFEYNSLDEIDTRIVDMNGTIMWMSWKPSFFQKIPILSYSIYIMDRVDIEKSNLVEVQSDSLCISQDLIAGISDSDEAWNVDIDRGIAVELFKEKFSSMYAGCVIDIDIRVPNTLDNCQVPTSD